MYIELFDILYFVREFKTAYKFFDLKMLSFN